MSIKKKQKKPSKKSNKNTTFLGGMRVRWNNNKAAIGSTVKSTLVVAIGTGIGFTASKMLGRK